MLIYAFNRYFFIDRVNEKSPIARYSICMHAPLQLSEYIFEKNVHIKVYVYIRKKCEMYFQSLCKAFTCDSCETHSVAFFNIQKSKLKSLVALKRKNMHFKNEKSDKFSAKFFMTFPLKFFLKNYITDPMIFFISYKFLSNKL